MLSYRVLCIASMALAIPMVNAWASDAQTMTATPVGAKAPALPSLEAVLAGMQFGAPETIHQLRFPTLESVEGDRSAPNERDHALTVDHFPILKVRLRFIHGMLRQYTVVSEGGSRYEHHVKGHNDVLELLKKRHPGWTAQASKRHSVQPTASVALNAELDRYKFSYDNWLANDGVQIDMSTTPQGFKAIVTDAAHFRQLAELKEAIQAQARRSDYEIARAAADSAYRDYAGSFLGKDATALVMAWGAPHRQVKLPNGEMAYTWEVNVNTFTCTTTFMLRQNKVYSWAAQGNRCEAPRR